MSPETARGALAGVVLSLAAAATFGVLAPAAKGAVGHVGPFRAAGLTYLAAGLAALGLAGVRRLAGVKPAGRSFEARDAPRLLVLTLLGGAAGPALFFAGVARLAAHHVAVFQHLEFGLTALAAVFVLGERPGRRGLAGLVLVGSGLVALTALGSGQVAGPGAISVSGVALVVAACAAWAVDNTLARGASELDPLLVVAVKGIGAGAVLSLATIGDAGTLDREGWALVLLAGGVGVGLSLVLELLALRRIGAATNAGLFATGPAFGFVWSIVFLGETAGVPAGAALALCASGAVALAVDRHGHRHRHEPLRHTHSHDHLDGHHAHGHDLDLDPATRHVHEHEHGPLLHSHPHVHDAQHHHRH